MPGPVLVWAALAVAVVAGSWRWADLLEHVPWAQVGIEEMVVGALIIAWAVAGVLVFTPLSNDARRSAGYRTRSQPQGPPALGWPESAPRRWPIVLWILLLLPFGLMAEFMLLFIAAGN